MSAAGAQCRPAPAASNRSRITAPPTIVRQRARNSPDSLVGQIFRGNDDAVSRTNSRSRVWGRPKGAEPAMGGARNRPSVGGHRVRRFTAGKPRDAAVGIGHHPGAGSDRGGDEELRPIPLIPGHGGDPRYPDEQGDDPEYRGLEVRREPRIDAEQHPRRGRQAASARQVSPAEGEAHPFWHETRGQVVEQDAAGEDHGRTQQQTDAGSDLYDSTEMDYDGAAGQGLADRLPDQSRISVNQTDDAQADHHCREECTAWPDRYAHGLPP